MKSGTPIVLRQANLCTSSISSSDEIFGEGFSSLHS